MSYDNAHKLQFHRPIDLSTNFPYISDCILFPEFSKDYFFTWGFENVLPSFIWISMTSVNCDVKIVILTSVRVAPDNFSTTQSILNDFLYVLLKHRNETEK